MSRCFPFPPPGYDEKKARPEDDNLLTKEKNKEKKHKKDKKDKKDRERIEGKDKKDKERSEEKHKKKKDRKDKHKEKKEKQRDREKKRTSNEKNTAVIPECCNGEKPGSNCMPSDETNESKFLLELGKRIRDDDRAMENHMVRKITLTCQRSTKMPRKMVENNALNLPERNEKFKDKREDDRKVRGQSKSVDARGLENNFNQNFTGVGETKVEGVVGVVDKNVGKQMEQKEKNNLTNGDRRRDRDKDRDREKKSKSKDKKRDTEKKEKAKENQRKKEPSKEQLKPRESDKNAVDFHNIKSINLLKESNKSYGMEGSLGKRKELERNGLLHDNVIRPSKLPRPVSSSHEVENGKKLDPCKTANQSVNDKVSSSQPVTRNGMKLESCPATIQFASDWQGTENNNKMNHKVSFSRPVLENGIKSEPCQAGTQLASWKQGVGGKLKVDTIHFASDWQGTDNNHKVNYKGSSSRLVLENEIKSEPCQSGTQLAPGKQGVGGKLKVDRKEHKINGLMEVQQSNVCSARPSSVPILVEEDFLESNRPPHPDSKYLSQILSVSKVAWSGFDEQEWLFGSNDAQAEKQRLGSQVEGTKQVWADALWVESADVTALPYVIPY